MKKLLLLSIALAPISVFSEPQKEIVRDTVVSFNAENDFRFSDRYYTNAIKLNYTDPHDDWWTSALQFKFLRLFADFPNAQVSQTASLGQDMYVGYDISIPNPPLDDRPYAGWLYLSSGAHIATKNSLNSMTINLGIVGPQSYADEAQKLFHSVTGDDKPQGWHNQIKNEPGIIIAYSHAQRLLDYKITDGFRTDFIGGLGANLGNVNTEGRIKALGRIGFNLPYNFEAQRIDAASGQDVEWIETSKADWHLYLSFGGIARFVGYDITLDGNTFANSRSVDKKWLVGETNLGISARYKLLELCLNWTVRTEDFNTQRGGAHVFWSGAIKVRF